MSQQSDMAERVYGQLAHSDVSAAEFVQELRDRWGPEHGAPEVHRFVEEVAACVLQHDDAEVGDIRDGRFTGWRLEAWDAHAKLAQELLAMDTFLDDKKRYVFRRMQKT
jgi:hypothetical protein